MLVGFKVALPGGTNYCPGGWICPRGLGIGGNYDFFLAEPIFKISSLNMFRMEPLFHSCEFEISRPTKV